MTKDDNKSRKFMSSVKVGPKGQIVIPKEVRDMFNINPGDMLILLADSSKGIAIERLSIFSKIADEIFTGKSKEFYPDKTEDDCLDFANEIKKLDDEAKNERN